jgi:hypothetical protein
VKQVPDGNIIWRMCFACWITKATRIHSEYVILTAFPRQEWFRDKATLPVFFFLWRNSPTRARAASCSKFVDNTKLHITVGRAPLNEESAHRRDLYVTLNNTHKRHISIATSGIQTRNPSKRVAETPCHRDRHNLSCRTFIWLFSFLLSFHSFLFLSQRQK